MSNNNKKREKKKKKEEKKEKNNLMDNQLNEIYCVIAFCHDSLRQ